MLRFLDGLGGRIENATLFMKDGTIAAVGQDIAAPENAQVIDGAGQMADTRHHRCAFASGRLSLSRGCCT